jgi:hypothetical protein
MNKQQLIIGSFRFPLPRQLRRARGQAGFSLVETMFALGIFALGFVAVAALFPVAILLQRKTVEDVHSLIAVDSTRALVTNAGISNTIINAAVPMDNAVHPLLPPAVTSGMPIPFDSIRTRSYPSAEGEMANRRFFWVPMVRRINDVATIGSSTRDEWEVFVFITKRQVSALYPKVAGDANPDDDDVVPAVRKMTGVTVSGTQRFNFTNSTGQVKIGDQIVDKWGRIHEVGDADTGGVTVKGLIEPDKWSGNDADEFWYCPPSRPGASSPIQRVLIISGVILP